MKIFKNFLKLMIVIAILLFLTIAIGFAVSKIDKSLSNVNSKTNISAK